LSLKSSFGRADIAAAMPYRFYPADCQKFRHHASLA
jgi:hypothetical protein